MDIDAFVLVIKKMPDELRAAAVRGLQSSAMILNGRVVDQITQMNLVDVGELRNSVNTTMLDSGAIVHVDSPHGAPLEYGARPFTPPFEPIFEWVKRKGLNRFIGPRQDIKPEKLGKDVYGPRITTAQLRKNRKAADEDQLARQMAWAIVNKFKKEGFRPRGYFKAALVGFRKIANDELSKEIRKELKKLGR